MPLLSLNESREAALNFAKTIASKAFEPKGRSIFLGYQNFSDVRELSKAIIELDEQKDKNLGIVWHDDGKGNRIRDARNIVFTNSAFKEDAYQKYAMQVLNEARAGIMLLEQQVKYIQAQEKQLKIDFKQSPVKSDEITKRFNLELKSLSEAKENLEASKKKLYKIADRAVKPENITKLPKEIRAYNSALVDVLKDAGITKAAEALNFAKEIASFRDEHKNIITLTSLNDSTIVEADVIIELTEEQKAQYTRIAKSAGEIIYKPWNEEWYKKNKDWYGKLNAKERKNFVNPDQEYDWYNELPEYKRKLIAEVAADIAAGRKVIPAQLRELIGLRNAYEKTTAIITEGKIDILTESLHCGAPASKNEQGREVITKGNIAQLKENVPGGKVNLNILSSLKTWLVAKMAGDEKWITDGVRKGAKGDDDVEVTASPINSWRLFGGGRDQENFKMALKKLADKMNNSKDINFEKNKILRKYLGTGKGKFEAAREQIEELYKDSPMKVGLLAAINARRNLNRRNIAFQDENVNEEISADMLILEKSLNDPEKLGKLFGGDSSQQKKTVTFCKSGKDRTGKVMQKATRNSVKYSYGLNDKQAEAFLGQLAAAGHTQEMAGIQGGTVGNHSIKMNPEFGLNKKDKIIDGVINQKSAGYNSEIKLAKTREEKRLARGILGEMFTGQDRAKKESKVIMQTLKHVFSSLKGQGYSPIPTIERKGVEKVK